MSFTHGQSQEIHAPVEIFCSYAREDNALRDELEKHLGILRRQGLISSWHDRQIVPGTDWAKSINTHLETASLILLLISPDFLASDYCYGLEMKRAMERHQANEARVIPILLRPVSWEGTPFSKLKVLPSGGIPLRSQRWHSIDDAFVDIANRIRAMLQEGAFLPARLSTPSLPQIWNIPYPRNTFFTGRNEVLMRLSNALAADQALSQPQAISGLGGVGKTQLALEYAYRHRQDYHAVLWAQADLSETLITSFLSIAFLLNLPEKNIQESAQIVVAVKRWLQTHTSWLLILDNADDLKLARDFLPPIVDGHIILTTRAQAIGSFARHLGVDTFSVEQGIVFLLRRSGLLGPDMPLETISKSEQVIARTIGEEMGWLPLALDQAGAYIEETGCRLIDYVHIFQRRRADLLAERRGQIDSHPELVATTWSLSFKRVEKYSPVAAELLRLCAFLAPILFLRLFLLAGLFISGQFFPR